MDMPPKPKNKLNASDCEDASIMAKTQIFMQMNLVIKVKWFEGSWETHTQTIFHDNKLQCEISILISKRNEMVWQKWAFR